MWPFGPSLTAELTHLPDTSFDTKHEGQEGLGMAWKKTLLSGDGDSIAAIHPPRHHPSEGGWAIGCKEVNHTGSRQGWMLGQELWGKKS